MLEAPRSNQPGRAPGARRARLVLAALVALLAGLLLVAPVGAGVQGSVTVNKFDAETQLPLANACFVLVEQAPPQNQVGEEQCTDATGTTTFPNVPPGDYFLFETAPPPGYGFVPEPISVTVTDTEPNPEVAVPNELLTGALQVQKFNCTGAAETQLHVFVNPFENEFPSGLGLEACAIGHATFLVTGGELPEPLTLETNILGFTFAELEAGTYQLYETSPNQAGPVSFTLTVGEFGPDFALAAVINPLELPAGPPGPPGPQGPAGPPGPAGQPAPAATQRAAGRLPDTAVSEPAAGSPAVMWLAAVAAGAGISVIGVRRARRR